MSIRNILKEHYGPGFVLSYWKVTDAYGKTLHEVPDTATCVHGHYQADQLAWRFPEARLITWVRDPVERVVSSYYHRLRDPDWRHPVCQELHAKKLSVVNYAALPLVRNEMTHYFGSKRPADFFFIGVMEEFEHSLAGMSRALEIPAVSCRHDNFNPDRRSPRYDLDPEVRQAIAVLNQKDTELYEECLSLVADRQARPAAIERSA